MTVEGGVHRPDKLCQGWDAGAARFDHHQHLRVLLDLALPLVDGGYLGDDVHAGRQPPLHHRPDDLPGLWKDNELLKLQGIAKGVLEIWLEVYENREDKKTGRCLRRMHFPRTT